MIDYSALLPPHWEAIYLPIWFAEDFPGLDITSAIVESAHETAQILLKSRNCILAGRPFVDAIFNYFNCTVKWNLEEGQSVINNAKHVQIATVEGKGSSLLKAERIALNLLARCSSIATNTCEISNLTQARLAGTRKTTPGFRLVEKYALAVAGIDTHRMSCTDCIMIKDNHIDLLGGNISEAVKRAKSLASFTTKIEVECRSVADAKVAIESGADIVMLDNFIPSSADLEGLLALKSDIMIELSGGITPENLPLYPVNSRIILSLGALTHSLPPLLDFSFKVMKQ